MEVTYPTADHIVEYNVLVLKKISVKKADRPEVLSLAKLRDVLEDCRTHDGDIYEKATILLQGLVQAHAFASGNRRTAFLATKEFLVENGVDLGVSDDEKNARVLQGVREGFYSLDEIATWLRTGEIREFQRHSKRR